MKKSTSLFLLGFIMLFGFMIRIIWTETIPVGTYIDETAIGLDAYVMSQTGKDVYGNNPFQALFYSYGDFKLPVYLLADVPFVKLFGRTAIAIRFPSILAGCISIFAIWSISLRLFYNHPNKRVIALVAAAVTAILPWSVLFSRTGFEGHFAQAMLLVMIAFLLRWQQNKGYVCISIVFGLLAMYTYFSARYVVPVVFLLVLCLSIYKNGENKKKYVRAVLSAAVGLGIFLICFLPMLRSPLYAESQKIRLSSKNILMMMDQYVARSNELQSEDHQSIPSKLFHHRFLYLFKNAAAHVSSHMTFNYLFFTGDSNLRHSTGAVGIMLLSFALPFFIGMYVLVRKYWNIALFLFLWWLISVTPASIPVEVPHALRSINALGIFPLVLAIGLVETWIWMKRTQLGRIFFGIYIGVVVIDSVLFFHDYFMHYPKRSAVAWSDGYLQVAQTVSQSQRDGKQIYVVGGQKLLIWILYYGGFSPKEITSCATIARQNLFDVANCDTIHINMPAWQQKVAENPHGSVVIGEKEMISNLPTSFVETTLTGRGGVDAYAIYIEK